MTEFELCFRCGGELPQPPRFPRGYCSVHCMQAIHRPATSGESVTTHGK